MRLNEKGFTLLEALFAMLIASAGITAALEIHSLTLKNHSRNRVFALAHSEIESLMEKDRGRLKTLMKSSANAVENMFNHVQSSPLSCDDRSKLDCVQVDGKYGSVCRAPENTEGAVKIKYIYCFEKFSFKGEQFIYVRKK